MLPTFLERRQAAKHLTEKRGLRYSRSTLEKLASVGGGPPYRIFGNRAVYTEDDLDAWADSKLSKLRTSTSEVAAP